MRAIAPRLGLLCAALCGVIAAHALAYVLVFPQSDLRHHTLGLTGHAYWPSAVLVAVALGIATVGARTVRELRGDEPRVGARAAVLRLALTQGVVFVALETLERAAAGVPLGSLVEGFLLPVGIATQALVAALIVVAVRLLARGAAALIRSLRRSPRSRATRRAARPTAASVSRRPLVLAGAQGSRGPPSS